MQGPERDPRTYALIGAAMEVHNELGPGLGEPQYQEAYTIELGLRRIPNEREKSVALYYKGHKLNANHRLDLLAYGAVIVELKAISKLTEREDAQVISYLRATQLKVALLINFGERRLVYKRFAYDGLANPHVVEEDEVTYQTSYQT